MLSELGAHARHLSQKGRRMVGVVRRAAVPALVSALVLLVGVATGAIPGSADGKISACYGKVGGVVRVIDVERGEKCSTALEKPLAWNIAGPAGRDGPQGRPGPQGEQGLPGADAGPSAAFRSSHIVLANSLPESGSDVNVQRLTLPAGDYLIWATSCPRDRSGRRHGFMPTDSLQPSGTAQRRRLRRVRADPKCERNAALSVMGSVTLTAPTEIFVTCFANPFSASRTPIPSGRVSRAHARRRGRSGAVADHNRHPGGGDISAALLRSPDTVIPGRRATSAPLREKRRSLHCLSAVESCDRLHAHRLSRRGMMSGATPERGRVRTRLRSWRRRRRRGPCRPCPRAAPPGLWGGSRRPDRPTAAGPRRQGRLT